MGFSSKEFIAQIDKESLEKPITKDIEIKEVAQKAIQNAITYQGALIKI